jgi:hypothetical protein
MLAGSQQGESLQLFMFIEDMQTNDAVAFLMIILFGVEQRIKSACNSAIVPAVNWHSAHVPSEKAGARQAQGVFLVGLWQAPFLPHTLVRRGKKKGRKTHTR